MKSRIFNATIVFLLSFVLVTPSAFFMVPQKASAQPLFQAPPLQGFTPSPDLLPPSFTPASVGLDPTITASGFGGSRTAELSGADLGANSFGCAAAVGSIAASIAGTASVVKVLGTGPAISTDPSDIAKYSGNCLSSTLQLIQQSITSAATVSSSAALQALVIDAYVLQPLAFILSGNLLKLMTQGVIQFVIGKANGTGIPQFVADIRASLQTVSDANTIAYFNEFIRSSRSPWNTAILSQLRKEYLNETSLAGFWAENMDTLKRTSPYAFGYLNGNWAQGGVASWFALTTQFQNNPYLLYPTVKEQLASVIGPGVPGATGARVKDIENGQGFVSWCGSSDGFLGEMTTDTMAGSQAADVDLAFETAFNQNYDSAINDFKMTPEEARKYATEKATEAYNEAFAIAKEANKNNSFLGVAPGDPCTNADGTTGTIKTPGSVILASLNKALGGQQDNVVRMGNVGPEINNILANIGVVLKTVNFATQILGGPGSGGIFGVDQPSGAGSVSSLRQYADSPGNLGATNKGILENETIKKISGPDMLERVAKYESAVNVIREAANTASTSVTSLISYCADQVLIASSTPGASTPIQSQLDAARTAFTTKIAPVLSQTASADRIIAAARALVQKIQDEQNATTEAESAAYAADLQTLQSAPPSPSDVANAQQATVSLSLAKANPTGSLTVSGGSLVEQLGLLSTNADALRSACIAPAPAFAPAATTTTTATSSTATTTSGT